MNDILAGTPAGYADFLADLKTRVRQAQLRAGLAVNRELVVLYWQIGRDILARQRSEGWGAKIIDRLAADLRASFPEMRGLSPRNLKYMRSFAEAWPDEQFVQQVVAQIPWGHNVRILDYVRQQPAREWYICKTIEHGWSRNVLVHQIQSDLYNRQGRALSNFSLALPEPQSDLAQSILKDPYNFDFLCLGDDASERELHRGLLEHLRAFLLELGVGFAFVGSQYHLEVGRQDFYIDLLFYHLRLRCFVVIELKVCEFEPEFAGKMGFYLAAVDDLLRYSEDQPSIGIILCKTKERVIVEYALRDNTRPIGVAEYKLSAGLPEPLQRELPTVEELEEELQGVAPTIPGRTDEEYQ